MKRKKLSVSAFLQIAYGSDFFAVSRITNSWRDICAASQFLLLLQPIHTDPGPPFLQMHYYHWKCFLFPAWSWSKARRKKTNKKNKKQNKNAATHRKHPGVARTRTNKANESREERGKPEQSFKWKPLGGVRFIEFTVFVYCYLICCSNNRENVLVD